MNAQEKKDEPIETTLRETHDVIQPQDSWEALRGRIDKRVFEKERSAASISRLSQNAVFWRRVALAAAACLVVTSVLLIYTIRDTGIDLQTHTAIADQGLLNQNQLEQLSAAFAHVRELFGTHCPWMVIDSGGEGQIGINNRIKETLDSNEIIVIRLAVNMEGRELERRYFDVVTFSNQQVSFGVSVAESSNLGVSIKPVMTDDGKITVEIKAEFESGTQAGDIVTVANDKFTSLVRVKSNHSWVDIDAVGQVVTNI